MKRQSQLTRVKILSTYHCRICSWLWIADDPEHCHRTCYRQYTICSSAPEYPLSSHLKLMLINPCVHNRWLCIYIYLWIYIYIFIQICVCVCVGDVELCAQLVAWKNRLQFKNSVSVCFAVASPTYLRIFCMYIICVCTLVGHQLLLWWVPFR